MLAQIPGIGIKTSQCLLDEFGTMDNIKLKLKMDPNVISNFKPSNGKKKMGKKCEDILKRYLL